MINTLQAQTLLSHRVLFENEKINKVKGQVNHLIICVYIYVRWK